MKGITEPSGSPFADQSFNYDPAYNREAWTLGTKTTNYTVNNLDQYTAVGSASPTWNSDGGLAGFEGKSYVYDALRRLTEVDYTGGKTLFSYDPLGRRVKKIDENSSGTVLATYQYHYDGSEVAVEYQPSTTWTYYLGNGIDHDVLRDSGSVKQWYYRDGQGSVSAVADNSGNLLEAYEYTAQGWFQITNGSGTVESATQIANYLMFTGREYDSETGNYFYRARYYSPKLGRFISRDPLSGAEFSQGSNLYAYCRNNYLNLSDPTGMSFWGSVGNMLTGGGVGGLTAASVGAAIGGGVGAIVGGVAGAFAGGVGAIPGAIAGFEAGSTAGAAAGALAGTVGGALSGYYAGGDSGDFNPGEAAVDGYNTGFDAGIGAGAAGGGGLLGDLAGGALTDGAGSLVTGGVGRLGDLADALSDAGLDLESSILGFDGAMIGADISQWKELNKTPCEK